MELIRYEYFTLVIIYHRPFSVALSEGPFQNRKVYHGKLLFIYYVSWLEAHEIANVDYREVECHLRLEVLNKKFPFAKKLILFPTIRCGYRPVYNV